MKKLLKTLLFLPIFALSACGGNNGSVTSVDDSSSAGASSNSLVESSTSEEKQYPRSVLESKWGLEAAIASYEALGLAIPYLPCDSFEFEVGVDDYGDPDIWFYCYFQTDELAEKAFNDYLLICAERGFSGEAGENTYIDYETFTIYTYPVAVVDRVILEDHGIELQFLPSTWNGKPCLGIYGITYLYIPEDVYPQKAVDQLLGDDAKDVPKVEGKGYLYDFMFIKDGDTTALEITVVGPSYDVEEYYFNELLKTEDYAMCQCNDNDDDYFEIVDKYPGYELGMYYYCMSNTKIIIFEFDLYNNVFIIDIFAR